ncbi:hypothetical protein NDU88_000007, partial [Pleurodeles waltl]
GGGTEEPVCQSWRELVAPVCPPVREGRTEDALLVCLCICHRTPCLSGQRRKELLSVREGSSEDPLSVKKGACPRSHPQSQTLAEIPQAADLHHPHPGRRRAWTCLQASL